MENPAKPLLVPKESELPTYILDSCQTIDITQCHIRFAAHPLFVTRLYLKMSLGEKYTVILPTYNERRNLPIIIWLLARTFTAQYAVGPWSQ